MNCYESDKQLKKFNLIVAEDTEFNLTRDKVYVVLDDFVGPDLVLIEDDKGIVQPYSIEYFRHYEGEPISSH